MIGNLVLETCNAPGTSTSVNLLGPATGRLGFLQVFASSAVCFYFMDDGTLQEWGVGTVTAGSPNTLARTTVIGNSSGTTARMNFAGSTRIYNEIPAEKSVYVNSVGTVNLGTAPLSTSGTLAAGATSITGALTASGVATFNGAAAYVNNTAANGEADVFIQTAGLNRFYQFVNGTAGAAWGIARCDNAGAYLATAFQIDRATGNASFGSGLTVTGALTVSGAGGSFSNSLAGNGWQKFPGGLIIQWGTVSTGSGGTSVTFPITFPTALASIQVSANDSGSSMRTFQGQTTSGFFSQAWSDSGAAIAAGTNWIAVGW